MEWTDDGIVLGVRRHGEGSVIADLLTREHGRHLGLVRGGTGARMRPVLQPGNTVRAVWRARLDEHLGNYAIEGLTLALAQELPDGMCAVPLNPGIINTDMLQSAWGEGASAYPSPEKWAAKAVPFLLKLSAKDNGKSLSVPQ